MPRLESKSSKRRSRGGDILAILLLLAIVAGAGWLWWNDRHSGKKAKPHPANVVLNTRNRPIIPSLAVVERKPEPALERTNLPAPVTNFPAAPPTTVVSNPPALPPPPTTPTTTEFPRPAKNWLEAQIVLARHAISPGSIDGAIGSQTRAAFAAFEKAHGIFPSRPLDTNSLSLLTLQEPLWTTYTVTSNDVARLQPLGKTWLAKSQQSALEYETILELVAEKAHSHPALIQTLNPEANWKSMAIGTVLKIPDLAYPPPQDRAAYVVIHLSDKYLEAFGTDSNLLAHFPCSIAARVEKRPVGELHVAVIAPNPNYTLDPEIFAESAEVQAIGHKLIIPPGPNNPVGVAWIGLDKPGYGMHGTPSPEQIGHTESHGCFRLANWDAEYLVKLVWVGMPVEVVP